MPPSAITPWFLVKLWLKVHYIELRNVTIVALGCIGLGLLVLDPAEKVGYHAAQVEDYGIRHGSKRPGVQIFLRLEDGRRAILSSRAYNPALSRNAKICVLETRGTIRGGRYFQLALPSRCLTTG